MRLVAELEEYSPGGSAGSLHDPFVHQSNFKSREIKLVVLAESGRTGVLLALPLGVVSFSLAAVYGVLAVSQELVDAERCNNANSIDRW